MFKELQQRLTSHLEHLNCTVLLAAVVVHALEIEGRNRVAINPDT